jgi:nickel-dependent lactate racemase
MHISFPYEDFEGLDIPGDLRAQEFDLPENDTVLSSREIVRQAMDQPIGCQSLGELAAGKKKILIVTDDIHRPTQVSEFIGVVLEELAEAGIKEEYVEFMMALGAHRPMTKNEMVQKLGDDIVERFNVHNHQWDNTDWLEFIGDTAQGVPVWINKKVKEADLVIGIGAIMPIEVCGFTGGGKILVPGVCGEITNSEMHWTRVEAAGHNILGQAENPIRASIDELARKAGLGFIVNVIMNAEQKIIKAVAGDMVDAHRAGCKSAVAVYGVAFEKEFDIVIADGYPFDIEFWQVNKALDAAGIPVKKGGIVIIVSPCYEGFSQTHGEMLEFGYGPVETIKHLVNSRQISHKVVGVHMIQVSTVAVEKAKVILVSTGISKEDAEKAGLMWAPTAQKAFDKALSFNGENPSIAVLKNAARMLPIMND